MFRIVLQEVIISMKIKEKLLFHMLHSLLFLLIACLVCMSSVSLAAVRDEEVDWTDEGKRKVDKDTMGGTYESALAFFKDKSHFIFSFRLVEDSTRIRISSSWAVHYITRINDFTGRVWKVHVDAIPNYMKVFHYLENVYFRVKGTNGDTGVLRLNDCIYSYDGTFAARLNSDRTTLSHHTFGTATDLNAKLAPNRRKEENIQLIDEAVRDHLTYDGIMRDESRCWYEFTYTGSGKMTTRSIPDDIINYLLYELAFYRAGFRWGHYFERSSDAMHFSLTQPTFRSHDDPNGLRKVYEYAEE